MPDSAPCVPGRQCTGSPTSDSVTKRRPGCSSQATFSSRSGHDPPGARYGGSDGPARWEPRFRTGAGEGLSGADARAGMGQLLRVVRQTRPGSPLALLGSPPRAMSLPEVADREVAQVRTEMEGKLAAERERSHDLLTRLHDEISVSHAQVAGLSENIQAVTAQLAGLNQRVVDALASLDLPLGSPMAESPAPAIDAVVDAAPAPNGAVESFDRSAQEAAPAPSDVAETASDDVEPQAEA